MKLTRRTLLQMIPAAAAVKLPRRPNILFLSTDQQTFSALGPNPYVRTPAMDSLAARGVTFRNSFASYPRCSPSRACWFTGRAPHETGVTNNDQPIGEGIPTMGSIFSKAGYNRLFGGKWHLPDLDGEVPGFKRIYGCTKLAKDMDTGLADACVSSLRGKPREPFLLVAGFTNPHDICKWIRDNRENRAHPEVDTYPPAPANMAIAPDEPEYLMIHRRDQKTGTPDETGVIANWTADHVRYYLHCYYRMVEAVDREIGRVLAALRQTGLDRNTVVVLTADHGEGMGAHGWVEKGAFWEEVIHVPLIVSAPFDGGRGGIHPVLNSGYDLLSTMCDYAGIAAPEGSRGISLRPAVQGKSLARRYVVSELFYKGSRKSEGRMVRTERFKYNCYNSGARPEQLFDLQRDPGENFSLHNSSEHKAVLRAHRLMLQEWLKATKDDFAPPVGLS